MPCEDDGACARLFSRLDLVDLTETSKFVCCPELLSKFIISHTPSVDDRISGKNVLWECQYLKSEV
jgi:hypothetical protein